MIKQAIFFIVAAGLLVGPGCDTEDQLLDEDYVEDEDDAVAPPAIESPDAMVAQTAAAAGCTPTGELECDPRDTAACDLRGTACYPDGAGFSCQTTGTGPVGAPCVDADECAPGLFCEAAEFFPGCTSVGCCARYCRGSGSGCEPGQECVPWFGAGEAPDACWDSLHICADVE